MKKPEKRKNTFTVRIYDDDVLNHIDELKSVGRYNSENELISKIIERGAMSLLADFGKKKKFDDDKNEIVSVHLQDVKKKLEQLKVTLDDIFVVSSINETLGAMLFNIEFAKVVGDPVTEELLVSGAYSDLPEWLQDVKDSIIRRK